MSIALFFAPLDGGSCAVEVNNQHDWGVIQTAYNFTNEDLYPGLPGVWDVDADAFIILRATVEECKTVGLERFRQAVMGRWEDGQTWNEEVKKLTFPEYWTEFEAMAMEELNNIPMITIGQIIG